ncbi:ribonuclease domain-containing protein [Microlunatus flavus]|uniref:Ribonuclease T1 n=1 Tax=Microlunatus flavus TaxID=1036181 RepID=A0A1H9HII1_9ACTN|nr:ribonuclease domain-containing protein [Microlunatus flavus]SEQ62159.1 ribonuclease T1 [Microlunatus flavus]
MSAGPPSGARSARGPRNAVVAVALVALLLLVVLAGLLREGGSGAAGAPATASPGPTATSPPRTQTPKPRPTAGATSGSTTGAGTRDPETGLRVVALSTLPRQAQDTVALIDRGGPFPYSQDGVTFANRERRLPVHPRGWYREYTVRTPGEGDRGPRRIVTGDDDRLLFYTADHYDSFVQVAR